MNVIKEYKVMQDLKGWVKSYQTEKSGRRWHFRQVSNDGQNFVIDYLNIFVKN